MIAPGTFTSHFEARPRRRPCAPGLRPERSAKSHGCRCCWMPAVPLRSEPLTEEEAQSARAAIATEIRTLVLIWFGHLRQTERCTVRSCGVYTRAERRLRFRMTP